MNNWVFYLSVCFLVGFDQLLKIAIFKGQQHLFMVLSLIEVNPILNQGAAFQMLKQHTLLIIFSNILILIGCLFFKQKYPHNKLKLMAILLFFSGTFGNLIDRLLFGHVRDFLWLKPLFNGFNLSDVYISIAIICLAFDVVLKKHENPL